MDNVTEIEFLRAIESTKRLTISKHNTKEMREEKKKAWEDIKAILFTETGRQFSEAQLIKKWNNIQPRIKDNIKDGKRIEGGPAKTFSFF